MRALILLALSGCFCLTACAPPPVQRSLEWAPVEATFLPHRKAEITQIVVRDFRPLNEREVIGPAMRWGYFALFVWHSQVDGPVLDDLATASVNPEEELRRMVQGAITRGGLVGSGAGGPRYTLRVTLRHLYGTGHLTGSTLGTVGYIGKTLRAAGPYGYAAAEVELMDAAGRAIVSRWVVGSYHPRKKAETLALLSEDRMADATVWAAGDLVGNLMVALEGMLAEHAPVRPRNFERPDSFWLARITDSGTHIERARITTSTGVIEHVKTERLAVEPFAAPGEWVIDPLQGTWQRLSPGTYDQLVVTLQKRWDIQYVSNVRAAHFFGEKPKKVRKRRRHKR